PGNTCGGTFSGGTYSFTPAGPTPPATCDVSIGVCDGALPVESCDFELTTVTITAENDAPTIDSTAPTTATEDVQYDYVASATDADGLAPLVWSVAAGDTCGGSFVGSTYSFTPTGPTPPADCELAIQACDSSSPAACDTETVTITITAENDAPAISSTAPTTATEDTPYDYAATVNDPDGPGATWSVLGGD